MDNRASEAAAALVLARQRRDFAREAPAGVFDDQMGALQRALADAVTRLNRGLGPYRLHQAEHQPGTISALEGQTTVGHLHINRANLPELFGQVMAGGHEAKVGPYRLQPAKQPIGSDIHEWVGPPPFNRGYAEQLADELLAHLLDAVRLNVERTG
jgi:hypothetical protein